jgi:hypothetical protein
MSDTIRANTELVKWVAVALMTADHINKYLFNWTIPGLFEAGRLALPLFAMVIGYNLAQQSITGLQLSSAVYKRLFVFCLISTPIFVMLGGVSSNGLPLNILATLFVGALVFHFIQKQQLWAVAAVFLVGGAAVEFWWFGVSVVVAAAWYFSNRTHERLILLIMAIVSLTLVNDNFYAVLAIPLFFAVTKINATLPRLKWVFYGYYPAHLAVLLLVKIQMKKVGYFFVI